MRKRAPTTARGSKPKKDVIGVLIWLQVIGLNAVLRRIEMANRWPPLVRRVLVGILVSVPGTIEIMVLYSWMVRATPLFVAWEIFPQTAFLTVILSILIGLFIDQHHHAEADSERARVASVSTPDLTASAPDFFRRIPPALGRDCWRLKWRITICHTEFGSDLILLRLRGAIAELGPARGRQCIARGGWRPERSRLWSAMPVDRC